MALRLALQRCEAYGPSEMRCLNAEDVPASWESRKHLARIGSIQYLVHEVIAEIPEWITRPVFLKDDCEICIIVVKYRCPDKAVSSLWQIDFNHL